ncbi:hypothetical protein MUY14_26350 [Amycolatopsis sp. FBCC-B4732]|uniref:hypothetical protein n=1 Tax=Amycolatopsis sp. FBCC-B4732 TaxID=3079339 RepID=UPI001FF2E779|nr:hypothetical protein [Amycolatopsis sp. FBCC-B4732]UOX85313.1 hypothetical protein MUY14_26350 [Amycolatopsis sp. FBCC-B4732]
MTAPYIGDPIPRDSATVRRDVDAYRQALTETARSGDRDEYSDALASLRAAEAELKEAEAREFTALTEGIDRGDAAAA